MGSQLPFQEPRPSIMSNLLRQATFEYRLFLSTCLQFQGSMGQRPK